MQIKKMIMKWNLAGEANKLDGEGDKMGLVLDFLGQKLEKFGIIRLH